MSSPVKLNFRILSLKETARALGVPASRAKKVLEMVGANRDNHRHSTSRSKLPTARKVNAKKAR